MSDKIKRNLTKILKRNDLLPPITKKTKKYSLTKEEIDTFKGISINGYLCLNLNSKKR